MLDHVVVLFLPFLRNFHTVFHSSYTNLHFPPTMHKGFIFCTTWTTFLLIAIQTAVRWYLIFVSTCKQDSFLMTSNVEYLLKCLLSICMSSLENIYSGLPLIFSGGLFVFWYWVIWAVHIFWILIHHQSYHLQTLFPHSIGCIFILSVVSFALKQPLSLIAVIV